MVDVVIDYLMAEYFCWQMVRRRVALGWRREGRNSHRNSVRGGRWGGSYRSFPHDFRVCGEDQVRIGFPVSALLTLSHSILSFLERNAIKFFFHLSLLFYPLPCALIIVTVLRSKRWNRSRWWTVFVICCKKFTALRIRRRRTRPREHPKATIQPLDLGRVAVFRFDIFCFVCEVSWKQ